MFGKSAFGSTGGFGQPQQQQQPGSVFGQPAQQPQQGSAFGGFGATSAPSAFGAAPATTSAFGQPAQQSAFGAAPATTGFGATNTSAFGQARPSAFGTTQPSAFGATQPAASTGFGGGGFGSTSTTSAFGSTAAQPSGGLFGQRPATSAFGGAPTTSAFGQPQQQTSAFGGMGATGSAFGQPANAAGGVNQGTAIADFSPTQDRDITTGVNNFFQTITAMPQYKNYSLEELRLQDYQQNRKTASGAPGAGGAFGAPAGGAFGASTGATGSAFGQPAGATGGFGQQQQTSAFGQPAQTSAFGAGATSGGLFGQQQQPATTSAFGQPATGTSAFGASTSAFGQPAAASGFGAAASKPFSFGSTPAPATGGFGQPATSAFGQPAASTGAFGQQQPATTSAFGGFGQKPATTPATGGFGTGFGQPAATGGFGQPAATGGFGASTSKPASSFSFGATAPTSTAGGFGTGFGTTPAPATGGFGQPATGGLFGAAKPAAPTTSLFGNTGATTGTAGGFGGFGTGATGAAGTTGGLFGQKPATGLGGTGGGLFGSNTLGATTSGFGFGQQQQGTNSFNLPAQGGLTSFGTNPLQPGIQQQPLIATVDKNPYGNNPLFDLSKVPNTPSGSKSGASAVALDGSSRKSSSPLYHMSPRVVSKIKLRGFNSHSTKSSARQIATANLEGISDDAVLGSGAFAPRTHSKKLVFDNDVDAASIVDLINSKKSDKRRVMFDPQLEYVAAKENHATTSGATAAASTPATTTTTTTIISEVTTTKDAPSTSKKSTASSSIATSSASNAALKNDYYISPSLDTLANMPKEGLKHVQNLVVGRKGYGEIRFDQPVDLTDVVIEDIMGNIVVIEEKTVVVYPDQENKPAKGTQLNLPATIKIENCFSHDKNTGAPIKDPAHPRFGLFKERLRKRENVEFIDYTNNGEWTFKVQEF
ncbi:uncharacterized protein ATC70_003852 [Mucor velutinosus]|uniref:Peptidase S59 domain-containing protein n=1 Tax=Mucor velutinosus TaxID=708070 RepID=A0AAN7HXD6_9FUNG|nr:hypothetical protein ATC70_003852 [Mucor velutinosus]